MRQVRVCVGKMVSSAERCRERDSEPEGEPFLTIKGKTGERPCTRDWLQLLARFDGISKKSTMTNIIQCLSVSFITVSFFLVFRKGGGYI